MPMTSFGGRTMQVTADMMARGLLAQKASAARRPPSGHAQLSLTADMGRTTVPPDLPEWWHRDPEGVCAPRATSPAGYRSKSNLRINNMQAWRKMNWLPNKSILEYPEIIMKLISIRSRALSASVIMGLAAIAPPAFAWCYVEPAGFQPQDLSINMGRVVVNPETPVGAVLREIQIPILRRARAISCNTSQGGSIFAEYRGAAQRLAAPGFPNVYQTDVAGVGIRVSLDSAGTQRHLPYERFYSGPWISSSWYDFEEGMLQIQLLKIANQTASGPIAPLGTFAELYGNGSGRARPLLILRHTGEGTTVASPTCEVQTGSRNIIVDFGTVASTRFTGVGSGAVARDFDISLRCDGNSRNVGIRIDADQDTSNMPGVIKLNSLTNGATRIGIQLFRRDITTEHEIRFGQTISIGATSPESQLLTLPMRARYVQTQPGVVGAGAANGQATFTIQYD